MKSILLASKKIAFLLLVCSLPYYAYAHTETKKTITHHVENKTDKRKNNGGFLWKFSTGFVAGMAVMHIVQKTLLQNSSVSSKLCIYRQVRNLFR